MNDSLNSIAENDDWRLLYTHINMRYTSKQSGKNNNKKMTRKNEK